MPRCNTCGSANRDGAKICGQCGQALMSAGVGYGQASPPPPPPPDAGGRGNLLPTVDGNSPDAAAPKEGGAQIGGAASSTVYEGGSSAGAGAGGPRPAAAGRTVIHEEEAKPLGGWLVVLKSRDVPHYTDVPLYKGRNIVGKGAQLGSQRVGDKSVSDQHILIVCNEGAAELTDMGSSNGTIVNDQIVKNHALQKGDKVRIGKTTMVFIPMPG